MIKQDMFRGFKFAGFTIGAIGASVILQAFLLNPAFSDASQEHCKQLTPPGPGQISFCVEEKEEAELQKEINDCGSDVAKFMSRMNYHALGSKRAYSDAIKDIHPVVSNAIAAHCAAKEHEALPIRTYCYQQALELMEKDASDLEDIYVTSQLETPEVVEAQLIKQDHFLGKILFQQCGNEPTKNCFYYNLVAIHEQLTNAYNEMTGAFDEMSRWAIMAAACDSKIGSDACHAAREWKNTDFVQTKVTAKDYAPTYKLPGPSKSFNPPVRVENTDKFRTYHSHRKFVRRHKSKKKGKVTSSKTPGSANGSAKRDGSGGDFNGNGYGKGSGLGSGTGNPTPQKPVAKTPVAPKAPVVPKAPAKPVVVVPSPSPVVPPVKPATPQPGIIPSPNATAVAPSPGPSSPAPAPSSVAPVPAPSPNASGTPSSDGATGSPTGSPSSVPSGVPSGSPSGSDTGKAGGMGSGHTDDGKPHEELKCDKDSMDEYAAARNLPFDPNSLSTYLNLSSKLYGQQAHWACIVKQVYSDYPPAVVLARHGLAASRLTPELMKGAMTGNFTNACPKMKSEFSDMQADLMGLQQSNPSPELDKFTADVVDFNGKDCDAINAILKNQMKPGVEDPTLGNLKTDYCAWKKTLDTAREGSTSGMSIILAPCRN